MQKKIHNGFTLVELAIVLVIIGLLVGGVLQGQELIKQAQIRAHIRAINEVKLAFATFDTKYDAVPGDMKNPERFFPECNNSVDGGFYIFSGNGDRKIDIGYLDGNQEVYCIWLHLHSSGIYTALGPKQGSNGGTYPLQNVNFSNQGYGSAISPADSRFSMVGAYFGISADPPGNVYASLNRNTIGIGPLSTQSSGFIPADLYSIDEKMDDGKPGTGNMRAMALPLPDQSDLLGDCFTDNAGMTSVNTVNGPIPVPSMPLVDSEYIISEEVGSCRALAGI